MTFTTQTIASSLAEHLAPLLPGVVFYENPNQQGTKTPCMFLQQRYGYIDQKQGGRFLRRIGLDLTYLEDYNLPDLQELYQSAVEAIDPFMEKIPYREGEERTLLHTYEREYRIDLDALHYQFELKVWVTLPKDEPYMQTMDYHEEVIHGSD